MFPWLAFDLGFKTCFRSHSRTWLSVQVCSQKRRPGSDIIKDGCLTGLTSAIYVDEAAHPPRISASESTKPPSTAPALPFLSSALHPDTGLYIHARDSTITKVSIPSECLAFQTGEALQLITRGKFRAVPHFVRAGGAVNDGTRVARNTLAV